MTTEAQQQTTTEPVTHPDLRDIFKRYARYAVIGQPLLTPKAFEPDEIILLNHGIEVTAALTHVQEDEMRQKLRHEHKQIQLALGNGLVLSGQFEEAEPVLEDLYHDLTGRTDDIESTQRKFDPFVNLAAHNYAVLLYEQTRVSNEITGNIHYAGSKDRTTPYPALNLATVRLDILKSSDHERDKEPGWREKYLPGTALFARRAYDAAVTQKDETAVKLATEQFTRVAAMINQVEREQRTNPTSNRLYNVDLARQYLNRDDNHVSWFGSIKAKETAGPTYEAVYI